MLSISTGCLFGPKVDIVDSGEEPPTDTDTDTDDDGCEETWIHYLGEDEPRVGDEWTVWMKCDGALMMGAYIIQLDPTNFASLSNAEVDIRLPSQFLQGLLERATEEVIDQQFRADYAELACGHS